MKKIDYGFSLRQGTDVLNEAIEHANTAKDKSEKAEQIANQALANSESTQTQLDTIVIEGDSSVEAAQARVDSNNYAYSTLKERLDTEHTELVNQINQKPDLNVIENMLEPKADKSDLEVVNERVDKLSIDQKVSKANSDGIWYQYASPVAVQGGGKTFWSWVTKRGDIKVASFDHETKQTVINVVKENLGADDHHTPALLIRHDGRVIIFYAHHTDKFMRWKISNAPYDISSLGAERTFESEQPVCYPQAVQLSAENNRIYLFYRWAEPGGDNREWRFSYSDDGGLTFGNETILRKNFLSNPPGESFVINPYTFPISDGVNRIHFVSMDYQQIASGNFPRNIYHWYYEDGAYYKMDGTKIKDAFTDYLISSDEVDIVDNSENVNIWEIAIDDNGYPVIVYVKFEDYNTNHMYKYARWDGSQWIVNDIVSGGGPVPEAQGREWYSGGITLNQRDPSIVYLSKEVGERRFDVFKYQTHDGGETWELISRYLGNPTKKNFRPIYPRNAQEEYVEILFISGDYLDLQDYGMTDILMVPEQNQRFLPSTFDGALLKINNDVSIPSSEGTYIEWDDFEYDTRGFWNPNEPTKLTIPRGVNRVRLTANVRWFYSNSDVGVRWVWIRGNGSEEEFVGLGNSRQNASTDTDVIQNVHSAVIEVQEGDYFELRVYQNESSSKDIRATGGYTWFSIEVVN